MSYIDRKWILQWIFGYLLDIENIEEVQRKTQLGSFLFK